MSPTSPDTFAFADRVGAELVLLLETRSRAELAAAAGQERFSAKLSASLLCVAEILRDHVTRGAEPARLAEICAKQLEALLQQAKKPGAILR